jgi:hypothetical protein
MSELEEHGMNDSASLERGYRRLLACYPRAFRRENGEEILAVLMACAQDGQTRPTLEAAADLLKGAVRMRLRPREGQPRTVAAAVRLMYTGALAELAALITVVVTAGSVRSDVMRNYPAVASTATTHLLVNEVCAPLVIALWLWLGWAHSRRCDPARIALAAFFGLITMTVLAALASDAAVYAPANMIAAGVLWLVALASLVLIFTPASNRYFRPEAAAVAHPAG